MQRIVILTCWLSLTALYFALSAHMSEVEIANQDEQASKRKNEELNASENLRQIQGEWETIWQIDQPSHLTPVRVHGGFYP